MVHSEKALSQHGLVDFLITYRQKTIDWIESTGQTDFYDAPHLVTLASDKIARHFREYIGS